MEEKAALIGVRVITQNGPKRRAGSPPSGLSTLTASAQNCSQGKGYIILAIGWIL
ncbi:MAG TPA: hypothetical protein VGA82_04315 [Dehalococcoidales bacterium]